MVFTSSTHYVCPILTKFNFSVPVQTGPGAHPASVLRAPDVLPGDIAAEGWRKPPTPSNDMVKERVGLELHPYSLPGLHGLFLG